MQRDMDLCRKILLEIEDAGFANYFSRIDIDGYTQEQIHYHIWLLHSAGLIDAFDSSTTEGPKWHARKMTMAGHEFLEMSRNDTTWGKAKNFIIEKGQTLTIEALKIVLPVFVKQALGV
jgi:hypothetical protein